MYTPLVLDHFNNPRNVGRIDDYDGIGRIGDPDCGDFLEVTIKLSANNERIDQIRYRVRGCPAAIATASITSELASGITVEESLAITDAAVVEALGGLPQAKVHCSLLAVRGLQAALQDAVLRRLFKRAGIVKTDEEFDRIRESGEWSQYFHQCDGSCGGTGEHIAENSVTVPANSEATATGAAI